MLSSFNFLFVHTFFTMKKTKKKPANRTDQTELVIATFTNRDKAEAIVNVLHSMGYQDEEITIIMSDEVMQQHFEEKIKAQDEYRGHKTIEGSGVGSAIGGTLGAIVGAVAAVGSTLVVPGLGLLVAGPIAGGLAGAGAGGITGGLIGSLVGAGTSEEKAEHYASVLQQGGLILGVHPHTKEDAAFIENKLDALEAPHKNITHEEIASRAYDIYQAGSEDAEANWYRAEKELLNRQD